MYTVEFDVVGVTPIVFSRYVDTTRGVGMMKKGEERVDHEKRISALKAHVDDKGMMYIPACGVADCICAMARRAGDKFKGSQTYGKLVESALDCEENVDLGVHIDKSERHEGFFRLSKTTDNRVFKSFPTVKEWKGRVKLVIDDNRIPVDKMREYAEAAGRRIGLGSFRKQNKGMMGKFRVENFKASDME